MITPDYFWLQISEISLSKNLFTRSATAFVLVPGIKVNYVNEHSVNLLSTTIRLKPSVVKKQQ